MTAEFNIAPPAAPRQPATTWTCDSEGNWHSEQRLIWRDENGWHDVAVALAPKDRKETADVRR